MVAKLGREGQMMLGECTFQGIATRRVWGDHVSHVAESSTATRLVTELEGGGVAFAPSTTQQLHAMLHSNAAASSSRHSLVTPSRSPRPHSQRNGNRERKPVVNGDVKARVEEGSQEDREDDDERLQWNVDNFLDVRVGTSGVKDVSGI